MSDGSEDVLKPARDEVFRKLGRNIALFQQLEKLLKLLIAHSQLEGKTPEEIDRFRSQRVSGVGEATFGTLVKRLSREVLGPHPLEPESEVNPPPRVRIRTRFRIEGTDYVDQKANVLGELVGQRNRLVHCLFEDYNLFDADDLARLDAVLDPLADRVRAEIDEVKSHIREMNSVYAKVAEFWASPAGQAQIDLMLLQSSRIVTLLADIAEEYRRTDGWCLLGTAASVLAQRAPEELAEIKAKHGHGRLKALLLASERFDFKEESTSEGQTRPLFRVRPER